MKTNCLKTGLLPLMSAAVLALNSCSPSIPGQQSTSLIITSTSTTVVDTFRASATVTGIDATTRTLKLTLANGNRKTVKVGPDVANFNQIDIGDRVNVVLTEEIAAYLDKGAAPGATGAGVVALAPIGAKPGVVMAETIQDTVKITAIDSTKRKVTFLNAEGRSKTLKVGDHIDLNKVRVGDSVTIRQAEAVALSVEGA